MKRRNLFVIIFCILSLGSCVKDEKFYTISGRLLENCGSSPIAEKEIQLWQKSEQGNEKHTLATTTTDANGYFTFKYQVNNDNQSLSIKSAADLGYYTYMEKIPQRQNIENLRVFKIPTTSVKVKLNAINAYTSNDTLYHTDLRTRTVEKIAGPFASGDLYLAPSVLPVSSADYKYDSLYLGLSYKINSSSSYQQVRFVSPVCGLTEVVIDIR